jgi:hypothetical protein
MSSDALRGDPVMQAIAIGIGTKSFLQLNLFSVPGTPGTDLRH